MSEDLFSRKSGAAGAQDLGDGTGERLDGGPGRSTDLPLVVASAAASGAGARRSAFDEARLKRSIERAQRDAGEAVTALADEIVDIVRFTLVSRLGRGGVGAGSDFASADGASQPPLHADEIGAMVERALMEVGATATARSYIIARDRQMRSREAAPVDVDVDQASGLVGATSGPTALDGGGSGSLFLTSSPRRAPGSSSERLPAVRGKDGAEPFQARRIVAALIEEVELLPAQAEEVAEAVASVLASSGLRVVSTALVRELVSSQLLTLGHDNALKRHESLGLPRHDLTLLFRHATSEKLDGAPEGRRFERDLVGALLRRWALDEVVLAQVGEAHRRGDLFVAGLDALHRVRVRSMPASLVLRGETRSPFAALDRMGRLARDAGEALVVEDLDVLHGALTSSAEAAALAAAMGAVGEACDRHIDLAASPPKPGTSYERVAEALGVWLPSLRATVLSGATTPRLVASLEVVAAAVERGGAETGDAAEFLLRSGHLLPSWAPPGAVWVGQLRRALPSGSRERGSLGIGASIGINLPRLARRAGPWREDAFLAALASTVEFAVEAIVQIAGFQSEARGLHGTVAADRMAHSLLPVGLLDALRILGDGIARADQGSRILGFLGDAAQRLGAAQGLDLRLGAGCLSGSAEEAAAWFAVSDARQAGPEQPRLFADLPRPENERPSAYHGGPGSLMARGDAGRVRERSEALGVLFCTVQAGALVPAEDRMGRRLSGPEAAAHGAEFLETLARSPRVAVPQGDEGAASGHEITTDWAVSFLAPFRARWPRLAAWARFTEVRGSASRPLGSEAETTLF